jgi:hypothetical protein
MSDDIQWDNVLHQVYLSAREINLKKLPEVGSKLDKYAPQIYPWIWCGHDSGSPEGRRKNEMVYPGYASGISIGFSIKEPGIYYGTGLYIMSSPQTTVENFIFLAMMKKSSLTTKVQEAFPYLLCLKKPCLPFTLVTEIFFLPPKPIQDSRILI